MLKNPITSAAFPAALVAQNLSSIQGRDTEFANDPPGQKAHELRDITCMVEQLGFVLRGLSDFLIDSKPLIDERADPELYFTEGIGYAFLDLSGRCAQADLSLDFIATIYASVGDDKKHTYPSPADGAMHNFTEALGFFLTGDMGTAFASLLLGIAYTREIDREAADWLAQYFNETPQDLGG